MVIDSSAVMAILCGEPERRTFNELIEADPLRLMSAASYVETGILVDARFGPEGGRDLRLFLLEAAVRIEPVTVEQAELAREAFRRFGRGRHPAGLNFGDCFSYALAAATDEPLLFKGEDFAKTDLRRCA